VLVVFVRKVPTASGATAVQIAERVGDRDNVIEHVGSARTPAELVALLEVARARMHPGQGELELTLPAGPVGRGVITGKRCALLWQVLTGGYRELGFDAVGDDAFEQMVLARIVEPTSKADSLRVLEEIGVEHASLRTMFRSLKRCQARGYRDTLAAACYEHASTAGDLSLVLYDVTTLYFEAEDEDDLRKVGYSKERRVDPQVLVGLLVDRGGFPLQVGCFEGNKAEKATIIPIVTAFAARHSIEGMVVVADAGMLSAANLRELDEAGLRFIVGSRVTKAPIDLASHFRWHGDAFTDGQVIDTLTPRVATAAARNVNDPGRQAGRAGVGPGRARKVVAGGVGVLRETRRQGRQDADLQENRAKAVVAGEKAARTPRFVKTSNGSRTLDEASLARARRLEGLKGYVTNIPTEVMPAGEVIGQLPRPLAGRGLVPDVQERPASPAHLPPHQGRDRGPPDHRVRRPGHLPATPRPDRDEHQEDRARAPPDPADHHHHRRPPPHRGRPPHRHRPRHPHRHRP
jgi:hypothetical protein